MWQYMIRGTSEYKGTEPDIVYRSILQLICARISVLASFYLLHCADEPQKGRNSYPGLQPYFIGFCRVGVPQSQLFYVVYQPCSFACILVIFLADKVSSMQILRKLTALSLAVLCLFYVYFIEIGQVLSQLFTLLI